MASNSSTGSGRCTLLADTSSGAPLLFAGLSEERKVVCYNLLTKEKIQDYIGHTLTVSCIAVSMRHRLVCSGSSDSTVRVYKMSSGQQLRKYNHGDVVTTMLLAGNVLVTGSMDTTILARTLPLGSLCLISKTTRAPWKPYRAVMMAPTLQVVPPRMGSSVSAK